MFAGPSRDTTWTLGGPEACVQGLLCPSSIFRPPPFFCSSLEPQLLTTLGDTPPPPFVVPRQQTLTVANDVYQIRRVGNDFPPPRSIILMLHLGRNKPRWQLDEPVGTRSLHRIRTVLTVLKFPPPAIATTTPSPSPPPTTTRTSRLPRTNQTPRARFPTPVLFVRDFTLLPHPVIDCTYDLIPPISFQDRLFSPPPTHSLFKPRTVTCVSLIHNPTPRKY